MLKKERGVIPASMAARLLIHKKRGGRKPQARAKYIYNHEGRKLGRKRGSQISRSAGADSGGSFMYPRPDTMVFVYVTCRF